MSTSPPALLLLALAALPACLHVDLPSGAKVSTKDTVGDLGQVDFTYVGPVGTEACAMGCGLGMPLMAGDTEGIAVGPHVASATAALPPLAFSSSDPTLLDVSPKLAAGAYPGERQTNLVGLAPGSATLFLHDATTGALFDSTTVRIAAAASLSLSFQLQVAGPSPTTSGDLALGIGQQAMVLTQVLDGGGGEIAGWSAVSLAIADAAVATLQPGSEAIVVAQGKGQTTLTAKAGPAVKVVTVTVQ